MMSFLCPQNPGFPGGGRQATLRKGGRSLNEAAAHTWGYGGLRRAMRHLSPVQFWDLATVSLRKGRNLRHPQTGFEESGSSPGAVS